MAATGTPNGKAIRKQYTSISAADITSFLAAPDMADWAQIIGAGSTVLVAENDASVTITTDAAEPAAMIPGPWKAFTSTTATRVRMGNGEAPPIVAPPTNAFASANSVATTQSAAIESLLVDGTSTLGVVDLSTGWNLLTGAPMAIFADGTTTVPGTSFDGSKSSGICRWNNDAAPAAIQRSFTIPPDMDITVNAVVHLRVAKTGATNNAGNTTTMAVGLFNQVDLALYDADTDFGGASSALLPAATAKTIQSLTRTITAADLAAYPASVTITVKPTAGTLDTDDLVFVTARVVYKRKLRTV